MIRRLMLLAAVLMCLCIPAQAGGKKTNLVPQEGKYAPQYSQAYTFTVPVGEPFEIVVYQDEGTLPLRAEKNGGEIPSGAGIHLKEATPSEPRQACLRGTVLTTGDYSFGLLIQEPNSDGSGSDMLAILQVTLRVSSSAPTVEKYLGDGQGMVRVAMKGVNFRRTPGGTRLGAYDEGARFVWCSTQEKGGYTWYRVWSEDYGYGYLRGDTVQVEPPLRIVYTPGKETAFTLFITAGETDPLTPSLIMTERPEVIGFDTDSLVTIVRGGDSWTLLCFRIEDAQSFWIKADLRDEFGTPLECQLVYLTTQWEEPPAYIDQ